jgi:hypothetical protein
MWFDDLGSTCDPEAASGVDERDAWMLERATGHGPLKYVAPVAQMSKTRARWDLPPAPLGSHRPEWV